MEEPKRLQRVAVEAARAAGEIQREFWEKNIQIDFKGGREVDLVTEVDRLSEERILEIIATSFPDHAVLAEESGRKESSSSYRWVVDPLDGTTNYAHRFPFFCSSVAVEKEGEVLAGAVYNPIHEELFEALRGEGAFLNGNSLSVSQTSLLKHSLLATGFPYDIADGSGTNLENFGKMAPQVQGIRRAGSAALDLCYVAAGRFDGFWELKLNPWDTAAGTLVVTEAGGRVSDFAGKAFQLDKKEILASNGFIHEEIRAVLA